MTTDIEFLQFRGQLFDAANQSITGIEVVVQFYNINLNSWVSLTEALMIKASKFSHTIEIPDRISTTNQTIRIVREIIKSGGVPTFRIIKFTAEKELPKVIASDFTVSIYKEKLLLDINFGTNWLLKKEAVINAKTHAIIASSLRVFEFDNAMLTVEKEKEELLKEKTTVEGQLVSLNTTISSLSQEKEILTSEFNLVRTQAEDKEELLGELNTSLTLLNTQLEEEIQEKKELQQYTTTLKNQISVLENTIVELEAKDAENFEAKFLDLQKKVIDLERTQENSLQEKEAFLSSIDKLQNDIKVSQEVIITKDMELAASQTLIDSLVRKNAKITNELEEIKEFNAIEHPNKLSASKVYGSIVKDVIKADEELLNSKYKLANISLNLKTTVEKGPEGTLLGLIDFESAKGINGAAVSDISIDIVPNPTAIETIGRKMPSLLGLTETAVRKILLDHELKLDAVYHPTNDPNLIAGQSFKQSPAPGANIEEGQEVIVIFAKPLN
ncbi:PASTA domain-containing protein [Tenacibaculum sp. TC6]|uniref:PASTA domain-containing protein n=1 Tax=Tenacibaculum sp. TC6 TaxID=3423223 RepID=UPI003D35AF1A